MTTEPKKYQEKKMFSLVMALIFIDTLLYGSIVPLIPVYTDQFKLSPLSVGVVFSAYSQGLLLLSIPLGLMAEKHGYRRIFLGGILALTLATVLYGSVSTPWLLFLARFIQGCAAAASWTAGLAMVALLYPRQQGEKLGMVMAAMGAGVILGPPVGGALYHYLGYRGMFVALALLCFFVLLLVSKADFGRLAGGSQTTGRLRLGEVRQNQALLLLGVIVTIASSSFGMLEILLPNHLHGRFGLGILQIGLLFGLMGLVHALSGIGAGRLSDRYGYQPFVFWGLIATAACLPLLGLAPGLTLLSMTFCLVGITLAVAITPTQPLMYHLVANDPKLSQSGGAGLAYGIVNTCFSLGMLTGPLLGGLFNKYFGFLPGLIIFALLVVSSAALFRGKAAGAADRRFNP